ncbi:uncharacterized protein LOC111036963 [Myzus persicae]|uniref:uncharacterized protein LOC111036963 n=1 Tax=Myzus persicae TaxID=13164 RepID=UPI000B934914|nr:uncharacterized protein LOC111036963 [Myzus persicae]
MSDSDDTCAAIVIACLTEKKKVKPKRKQRVWMKEWLKKRDQFSHDRLVAELKISSAVDYRNYLRMDADTFKQRLLSTLRYLVSGDSFEELKFQTAIAAQTLGKIIVETCEALIYVLNGCIKVSVIGYILFFTIIELLYIIYYKSIIHH